MEMIAGWYLDRHFAEAAPAQIAADRSYQILTTIEESLEMIGATLFIYALMKFLTAQARTLTIQLEMKW